MRVVIALVAGTFLTLATAFAFGGFLLAFSFTASFAFDGKGISTPSGGFVRHIPVLIKEVLLEGGEGTLAEGGVGTPCGDVSIELRARLNRGKKVVNAREFRNVVAGGGEELVVLSDGAAEVSKIGEVNERGPRWLLEWRRFRAW